MLRCPSLMGGNHDGNVKNVLYGLLEVEKVPGLGVGFIPQHHPRPLVITHGGGAGIR